MVKWSGADVLGAEVRVPGATATPGLKDDVYLAGLGKRPDSGSVNDTGLPIQAPPRIASHRRACN
jgi:hypothetical protein